MTPYHVAAVCALLFLVSAASSCETRIVIDPGKAIARVPRLLTGACIEDVNHEIYGGLYSQMVFGESFQEPPKAAGEDAVSGMWTAVRTGGAVGAWQLVREAPFVGVQCQRLSMSGGTGEVGVANRGLNGQGMHFVAGKPYTCEIWVRAERVVRLHVAVETAVGDRLCEAAAPVRAGGWRKASCRLTPTQTVGGCRLVISLHEPGAVDLGYVILQPGAWGRFKGLPVRRDVAEALVDQGLAVLRYGGSMVNHPEYRWKKMIGPRERRPPSAGTWYPWSSNGWGIVDFLAFCRAAGFECIPAFNMGETPADMADFVEYANGPASTEWGGRRAADGYGKPFRLKVVQLGNEERVDEAYADRFNALADAIWAKDPEITLVVGDFCYSDRITEPSAITGTASGIRSLAGHRRILAHAKLHGRPVWFDVHIGTDGPGRSRELDALASYVAALDAVAEGAEHRVVVFEFNSGNRQQRRALANATAIHEIAALGGKVAIACSANCLQVDGQNDNDWDQGLVFMNPSSVWLQPPGWVTRMLARAYHPVLVDVRVDGEAGPLEAWALRSEDGRDLSLMVVNHGADSVAAPVDAGAGSRWTSATVETLSAPLDAVNTAAAPDRVRPVAVEWKPGSGAPLRLAPHSLTVVRFR